MDTIYFQIAGFNFQLNFQPTEYIDFKNRIKKGIVNYLRGFLLAGKPEKIDHAIDIIWDYDFRIVPGKLKSSYLSICKHNSLRKTTTYYRISPFDFQTVVGIILTKLLNNHNGFFLHASAVRLGLNSAYVFTGISGSGKSTVRKMLQEKYPALADDRIIIKKEKGQYFCYQVPFFEKKYQVEKTPNNFKLAGVFFLRKAKYFKKDKIKNKGKIIDYILDKVLANDTFFRIYSQKIFQFISDFSMFYNLHFTKNKISMKKMMEEKVVN